MSFAKTLYEGVLRRNSSFLLVGVGAAFVFERLFDPGMDGLFFSWTKGVWASEIQNRNPAARRCCAAGK